MTVSRADDRVETTIRLNRPRSPASHSAPADATATSRRSPRRRRVLLAGAAIVLAATACLAYFGGRLNAVAVADGQGAPRARAKLGFTGGSPLPGGGEGERARLETVAATVVSRSDVLRLAGSLAADELSAVAANTGGIAAEIRVDRGSFVRKGDVLVVLDATDARNKLAEGQALLEELRARLGLDGDLAAFDPEDQPEVRLAHASANLAAANLQRAKLLFPTKSIAQAEYEQMQAEAELAEQRRRQAGLQVRQAYQACKTAEAKLTILKKAVDDTTIRAPFDGWIAERLVSVGEQSERQLVAPSPRRCAIQASTRYEAANPIMENFAAVIACP